MLEIQDNLGTQEDWRRYPTTDTHHFFTISAGLDTDIRKYYSQFKLKDEK